MFKTGFWTGSAWKRAAEDAKVRAIEGAVRALRTALSSEEEAMDIVDGDDGDEKDGWRVAEEGQVAADFTSGMARELPESRPSTSQPIKFTRLHV